MFAMFLEEYMTLWHLMILILWIVANCALPWYSIWTNARLLPDKERDIERFKPFVRNDMHHWSYPACIITHFFFIPRYIACLSLLFYAAVSSWIILIGADPENLSETRKYIFVENVSCAMRIFSKCFGVL